MASPLDGLIFDALYGSKTLSSLLWTLDYCDTVTFLLECFEWP